MIDDERKKERIEFAINAMVKICNQFDIALVARVYKGELLIKVQDTTTGVEYFLSKEKSNETN